MMKSKCNQIILNALLLVAFLYGGDGSAGECRNTDDWQNAEGGLTALHLAAREGKPAEVRRLLAGGACVDARSASGITPLHLAVGTGVIEVVSALIEAGADLEATNLQDTPLLIAIKQGRGRIAVHLIDSGADSSVKDRNGRTVLELAEDNNLFDVVVRLQVPPVLLTGNGGTPEQYRKWLKTAAIHDSEQVARLLIEHGADINARDGADWTPLHYALIANYSSRRAVNVAKLLIESGADVNIATAGFGWTPLHLAVELNEPAVVEMLLAAGAEVNARTHFGGWTSLHIAEWLVHNSEETVGMLRAAGAQTTAYEQDPDEYVVPYFGAYVPGGYSLTGSFTTPGAEERLVIETLSLERKFVRLIDQRGTTRATMFFGLFRDFEQICLDPHSGTHSLVFSRSYRSQIHPEEEAVFIHYDNTAGELREVYANHYDWGLELIDRSGACHWRERSEARLVYDETVAALRVRDDIDYDSIDMDDFVRLPNRVIPAETVAAALETIENLPDGVAWVETGDYGEAGRWRIVDVRGEYYYSRYAVMLLWDNTREEWRSIFDGKGTGIIGVDKDTLFVEERWRMNSDFYEVDLVTYKVRRIPYYDSRLEQFRNR